MDENYQRVFKMSFVSVYPHSVQRAEKKGRTNPRVVSKRKFVDPEGSRPTCP
jgi:hypothetical protein